MRTSATRETVYSSPFRGGTAHRLAAVSESERSQLGREFVLSVIIGIGLGLGIERSVLHRGVAARELRGNVVHHAFRLRIILIGRHHVEHHILYIARSTLFESLLVVVIILFDIGLGNVHQRIGYGIVILADDVGRIGMVGNPHSVSHLQRVGIETALDQSKVLAHYPFLLHLIAQKKAQMAYEPSLPVTLLMKDFMNCGSNSPVEGLTKVEVTTGDR